MSNWMTIPEWSDVRQVNVYHREQEKGVEQQNGHAKMEGSARDTRRKDISFTEESALRMESTVEESEQSEIAVNPENLHVLVRGMVQLPADLSTQYEIWVSADDHYQLWVDGIYQGQGPISSNSDCAFYDRYPIRGVETDLSSAQAGDKAESTTRDGNRTVTIALHLYYHGRVSRSWNSADGRFGLWLSVRECNAWNALENNLAASESRMEESRVEESRMEKSRQSGTPMGNPSMRTASMGKTPPDEQWREVACADETWRYQICKAYSGETVGYDTQFLENFDSRLWPEGWEQPGDYVDDIVQDRNVIELPGNVWGYLVPALWADYRMLPRLILPLEEKKVFAGKHWEEVADDVRLVLDFGREITGAIVAEAVGPAGAQVLIQCGEELTEDQACVATPQVRWDMRCGCAYQEVWTLGDGLSRLHPYDYKGFRYAQLTFPSTVELRQVYAWVRHYPMEEDACTLRCEERELEQIFEICKNAVRCCSQDAYLDCPTREKGQYLGDALITARSQVWLTGSTELLRKCIGDFILSASISPSLMAVAPGSEMQEIADYSLLFPLLPMTDYEFTGDRNFLARCYPAVRKVTESFLIYQRGDGLLENVSALWNLVDWPENLRDHYDFPLTRPIVGEGCHNVINALWYGANKVLEDMERLLDLPVTGRCEQIAESFRSVFYREAQCLFADSEVSTHCSIHANLYAAFFGLLPKEAQEPYVRMLRTPGRVCGALPCYFALKSLAQMGRVQDCFDLLTRGDAYGWRNMVREGASASFEAWGKDQKWNTSLCHAWSSGFLPLFIEEIAGLHPDPRIPEGYLLDKPDIECPAFELQVPWRGQRLRV